MEERPPAEEVAEPPEAGRASIEACVRTLEAVSADRALLAALPEELRRRLLVAAGRVSRPERSEQRDLAKAFRRRERLGRRAADGELLDATGIRVLRSAPVFPTPAPALAPPPPAGPDAPAAGSPGPELAEPRKCYVCKAEFRRVHAFYDQMCAACGDFNFAKRSPTARLDGRVAVVTGGRVKIGYQTAMMLLRAGATVVVTTRFPRDAARRFGEERDADAWRDRLRVYGLDLRHTPSVELFARHLDATLGRLDFLINNACQTVRRPPGYYAHLMEGESAPLGQLPDCMRGVLEAYEGLRARGEAPLLSTDRESGSLAGLGAHAGLRDPAALSQLALSEEDRAHRPELFPEGRLDADRQQLDLRSLNSWRLTLAEVPTVELIEVQLVNLVAPFVLNARLKPLFLRHPTRDKHIVNVSAMEGQFYRAHKTDKHPHTNMAKAALNMMTRTSAEDYVRDGIHMNSVDTGWVTDEDPAAVAARKVAVHGFHPPLDIVDGAARVCDPIFSGFETGRHAWGQFLKDYKPTAW